MKESPSSPSMFLCIVTLLVGFSFGYSQDRIASVVGIKGEAYVKKNTSSSWDLAIVPMFLSAGDTVRAGQNSVVIIDYFRGSLQVWLQNGESYGISEDEETLLARFLKLFHDEDEFRRVLTKGPDESPTLLYPRRGKILTKKPDFLWTSSGSVLYEVKLVSAIDKECSKEKSELWETTVEDTLLFYPKDKASLSSGGHYWVGVSRETSENWEDYDCFTVGTDDEINRIKAELQKIHAEHLDSPPSDISEIIESVSFLVEEGYLAEAFRILLHERVRRPNNQTLLVLLASLYNNLN